MQPLDRNSVQQTVLHSRQDIRNNHNFNDPNMSRNDQTKPYDWRTEPNPL